MKKNFVNGLSPCKSKFVAHTMYRTQFVTVIFLVVDESGRGAERSKHASCDAEVDVAQLGQN